jgi:transposase-like protein
MKCPKCGSEEHCKDGMVKGLSAKSVTTVITVEREYDVKPVEIRRLVFVVYSEEVDFRAIGRILKINYITVFQWVKKCGENLELPKRGEAIEVIELDEMHTYVSEKKLQMGYGLLLTDMKKRFHLFYLWRPLNKHRIQTAETYIIERYNSRIRHYPARLK